MYGLIDEPACRLRLRGAVELRQVVVVAADHRGQVAGRRIDGDERRLDLGPLRQLRLLDDLDVGLACPSRA